MPELPEVEVVRRGIAAHALGRTLDRIVVHHPRPVRRQAGGADEFAARLRGRTIVEARRRGKFLWLVLDDEQALLVHLGMSGQVLVQPSEAPYERHLRIELGFNDSGPDLRFVDMRMFGGMTVVEQRPTVHGLVPDPVAHIALDPLDENFSLDELARRLRARHTGIKRALLDQTLISGIGNIYADEALWQARLHYDRPTEKLSRAKVFEVVEEACTVMLGALDQGGTSFDALYVNVNGQSGYFDRRLRAYGQEGRPCERCGTPIRREHFMNRSSFFCPRCQPSPRVRRA